RLQVALKAAGAAIGERRRRCPFGDPADIADVSASGEDDARACRRAVEACPVAAPPTVRPWRALEIARARGAALLGAREDARARGGVVAPLRDALAGRGELLHGGDACVGRVLVEDRARSEGSVHSGLHESGSAELAVALVEGQAVRGAT